MRYESTTNYRVTGGRGGGPAAGTSVPNLSADQRRREEERCQREIQERLVTRAQARSRSRPPLGYERPPFNTPAYWRDCARGWISDQQQQVDQADFDARRRRALDAKNQRAAAPHRHDRPAPRPSKQFAKPMATQAARDDRLTPQSKALLQVLVARTGRGRYTDATKGTLAALMSRCPRSIQRYLAELVKFGYLRTQVRKSRRTGFYIGLRIWVMNAALPFFANPDAAYDAEKWPRLAGGRRNREETEVSPTKVKEGLRSLLRADKPPWFGEVAY